MLRIKRKPVHLRKTQANNQLRANNNKLSSKILSLKRMLKKQERRHRRDVLALELKNGRLEKLFQIEKSKNRWYRRLIIESIRGGFTK